MEAIVKDQVRYLAYLSRTYDGVNKLKVSTENRCHAYDINSDFELLSADLLKIKGKISRRIAKELEFWPLWEQWMKHVPGLGPDIASKLILLYYYRFNPMCSECGGKLNTDDEYKCFDCGAKPKGHGLFKFDMEIKDFPTISKWWQYMGKGIDLETGRVNQRKSGVKANWSSKGKAVCYQIGEQIVKQSVDNPYKQYYLKVKEKRERTHPEASKMKRHEMAKHESTKLVLSHLWQIARAMDDLELVNPYIHDVGGHTNLIFPYFNEYIEDETLKRIMNSHTAIKRSRLGVVS